MAGRGQVAALGRLEGVREATLCDQEGMVLESSSSRPELNAAAMSLHAALRILQGSLQGFASPVTLTVDTDEGSLHMTESGNTILVVATGTEANLGAVRLEMREALRALNE